MLETPWMFDNPGELTALLTVGGFVITAFGGALGYVNSRITKLDNALATSSEAARKSLAEARHDTTARQDKIWDALQSHRAEVVRYQQSAAHDRNAMAAEMATKADLHREVDRLAIMLTRPIAPPSGSA